MGAGGEQGVGLRKARLRATQTARRGPQAPIGLAFPKITLETNASFRSHSGCRRDHCKQSLLTKVRVVLVFLFRTPAT